MKKMVLLAALVAGWGGLFAACKISFPYPDSPEIASAAHWPSNRCYDVLGQYFPDLATTNRVSGNYVDSSTNRCKLDVRTGDKLPCPAVTDKY